MSMALDRLFIENITQILWSVQMIYKYIHVEQLHVYIVSRKTGQQITVNTA